MTENVTKRKMHIIIAVFVVLAVVAAALTVYIYKEKNKAFTEYKTLAAVETGYSNETAFLPYLKGYLHYDRDGAEAVGSRGELLWNVGYNLKEPIAAACNEYVVVADRGNTEAYIFDGSGKQKKIDAVYPIQEVEVSEEGIAAIRTKNGTEDNISIISMDDTKYVDITTNEQTDGFPVDIALSQDGTRLVMVYLMLEEGELKSRISFYNFSQVGQNYVDRLVGLYKYDSLALKTDFIAKNQVSVFFEDGVSVYSFKELPSEPVEIKPETEIYEAFFDNGYVGIITSGKEKDYNIRLYTSEGKNVFDVETELEYTSVEMLDETIVLYNTQQMQVWDVSESLRYEGALGTGIEMIAPIGDEQYVVLYKDRMETIRLLKSKD